MRPMIHKSLWALCMLVPIPTLGTLAAMVFFPGTSFGQSVFAASKVWLFAFPVVWLKLVDRGRFSGSPVRHGGWTAGLVTGLFLSLLILATYLLWGEEFIDRGEFTTTMREIGLDSWPAYLVGATYWTLVNSVLEEYVWRWFVFRKCEMLTGPILAIPLSALFFTLHHFFALRAYGSLSFALICSFGVFTGGMVWSLLYQRYHSIWPGYLSHAIVDLMVFGLGAYLLFG